MTVEDDSRMFSCIHYLTEKHADYYNYLKHHYYFGKRALIPFAIANMVELVYLGNYAQS